MASILIVEDDKDIRDILRTYLEIEKYIIYEVESINQMNDFLNKNNVDIILLDVMLPDGESIDILPFIRAKNKNTGIIIISAKNTDRDKIFGIENGADDYITKPFNPREVIARVRALLKRLKNEDEKLQFGNLEIFSDNYTVKYKGKIIDLTAKEFEILYLLAKNPEKIFTRNDIIDKIWYGEDFITDRVIDVHISMIRSKIGKNWIKTIRNLGYKFNKSAEVIGE
ncbi:two-component system, OmpR family, response regulator [Marinitoga hydrogenitolerans DSM 16785]|uniref:Two-component system, OmpR family, response regulator n=1 Tax=Marinitoga hydrogenitolerans (strain DSM 16785 / JCM 12826 / AT1271) TaxID=1122195 RepID=A0A1M4SFU1_MARH1|nr:response regulator transcription factor [Marinitoga hydrogenitolerans]SHE31028.1 two-component system, OmpR family, response regulator [Marinitoga hydrogenitolerans DSM 16785]